MILTINCGSSSIKFTLFPAGGELGRGMVLCNGQIDGIGDEPRFVAVDSIGHQIANERLETGATHEDALGLGRFQRLLTTGATGTFLPTCVNDPD